MVEPQPSKLMTWVRFPLPAPNYNNLRTIRFVGCFFYIAKIIEMDSEEQNKVALYLFNSINYQIENMYKFG